MDRAYRGDLLIAAHPGSATSNLVRTLKKTFGRVHYETWAESRRDVKTVVSCKYLQQAGQFEATALWVREPIATVYSAAHVLAEGMPHADGPFFRELHDLFGSPCGPRVMAYEATLHSVTELYERCREWDVWRAEDFYEELEPGVNSHNTTGRRPWSWLVQVCPERAELLRQQSLRLGYADPSEAYPY